MTSKDLGSTRRSQELFGDARHLIPGGVNSPVRAFAAVGGIPLFIERAEGPFVHDVDGNSYVDYVMSWGPLVHGHAYRPVVDAISLAAQKGTSFGAPSPLEIELAKMIAEAMPLVEMIRFVNSGTEASMSAIRLARAYTKRDLIVKFAGNYHGHADMLLVQAGSGALTLGIPTSPGVPAAAAASTIVLPYNSAAQVEEVFTNQGDSIAAVIVEPIAANMGVVPPAPGFLESIRHATTRYGALTIFDEVITGFRVGPSGAQGLYGIKPDLTILGKIIGGGLPVGAYGGRREVMELVAPSGSVYQAGTLSGNPLTMAAGITNLKPLKDPAFYDDLRARTQKLALGLLANSRTAGIPLSVQWVTGMLTVFFASGSIGNLAEAQASDVSAFARFFHAMLDRGFYLPPSQYEAWMISPAHTDEIIDQTLEAARAAFIQLVQAGD